MTISSNIKLVIIIMVFGLLTIFCSTGYITPDSLTATASVPKNSPVPTAFFVFPTETSTSPPTPTDTPDPTLFTPTSAISSPTPVPSPTATLAPLSADPPLLQYFAQSGDTLPGLVNRFGVNLFEIVSSEDIPETDFIDPGQFFMIPQRLGETTPDEQIFPDSEIVFSPSTIGFDSVAYSNLVGGALSNYTEYIIATGNTSGADIVNRIAIQNSINPRILLSLLNYQSNWVLGEPDTLSKTDYPMGFINLESKGLYAQLSWAVNHISVGYYGWREGTLTHLEFKDGSSIRIAPTLNAGTVAIQYFFSQVNNHDEWQNAINPASGLPALHTVMFGDAQARASAVEPILPPALEQPRLILPFLIGQRWAYTGGPHGAWGLLGSQAALDFAPGSVEHGCAPSENLIVSASAGIVTRIDTGVVVIDLDGDGNEQTGWVLLYLHLDKLDSIQFGQWVDQSEILGKPSCKGGASTGTHLHFARKYNGEWIAAGGGLPFV
ncbi:MAG: M23 family metallopeptidase, partial [Chloroflexota bacterium]